MRIHMKTALRMLWIFLVFLLIPACQDPLFDLKDGIDTEIKVGGDSLTVPVGSTDTIRLKEFLNADDMDFLEIMEDGGYGLKLSDSLYVNDLLKDLDKSKLKFDDYIFSESASISFGDINVGDFKIPGFTRKDSLDLNIPKVDIGDIAPAVSMDKQFTVGFSDYALNQNQLNIQDFAQNTTQENLLKSIIPVDVAIHPDVPFSSTTPMEIKDENGNPLKVKVNYSIDVPAGITNIYQIDLESGASLDISLELVDADASIAYGTFTPAISIDPTNLFKFGPFPPLTNGKMVFDADNALTSDNQYKSTKKYTLTALHNLPSALNNTIAIEREIAIEGTMSGTGTLRANKAQQAKEIDLVVNVKISGLKIKNMDFDIPTFSTTLSGSSSFAINETGMPEQVSRINKVYFGKKAGSALPTNMFIQFTTSNLPVMTSSSYTIDQMNITFPEGFVFSNMAGRTYSAANVAFNTTSGFTVELNLSELDLSGVPITNGTLNWAGNISYAGKMSVNGRMNSKDINTSSDPVINLSTQTAIQLSSATVLTNQINEAIDQSNLSLNLEIDIAEQVARLTTINMKRGGKIRVNINRPTLPLNIKANNMAIQFSDLFEFYPVAGLNGNTYTINGTIPEYIELELKALHINKDLVNGKLSLNENITISGGVQLESGVVNSSEIKDLSGKQITLEAIVSDLFIESTSIELKTLEATYKDSTDLKMNINDIPSEIVSLDSIILKSGSSVALEINITNLPDLGSQPLKAAMKIQFPKILVFASGQVNANNEMTINENFVNGKLSKTIILRGLQFDGSNLGGKLNIDDKVGYDVTVKVENPTINSEELNNDPISVGVKVTLKGLEFQKVYGKFNVDFGDKLDIENLSFDLPDILKGEEVMLDISNPVLQLSTESNTGIPVDATLGLTKYKGGQLQTNDKLNINFRLPKSGSAAEIIRSNYWVGPSEDGKPAGYTFVPADLQKLFMPVPDSVQLDIKPVIDNSHQHLIDLLAVYNLKVKYDLNVPFKFGKDLSITIKDTIENVDLELNEESLKTGKLELLAKVINSIPLNLEMDLVLTDANYTILATSTKQSITAGAPDGSGVVSIITVKLADNLEQLKQLKNVILTFKATSNATIAGTPIKPDNFIKAELKARIGGVKITL